MHVDRNQPCGGRNFFFYRFPRTFRKIKKKKIQLNPVLNLIPSYATYYSESGWWKKLETVTSVVFYYFLRTVICLSSFSRRSSKKRPAEYHKHFTRDDRKKINKLISLRSELTNLTYLRISKTEKSKEFVHEFRTDQRKNIIIFSFLVSPPCFLQSFENVVSYEYIYIYRYVWHSRIVAECKFF